MRRIKSEKNLRCTIGDAKQSKRLGDTGIGDIALELAYGV